ncbi:MAG: cell division protein FtsA [Dehalococcoidales bacterium]|nr:cell division protein FtsA [Dehalococcoidales bacterium]
MKRTRIGAIDVGTTKVCTIMADTDGSIAGTRILGVGIVPSHGLQKGMVVNVNEAKESIRDSIRKAEQVAGYKMESAFIGITGRHVVSSNNKGAVAITRGDQLVRPTDLRRVLEVAKSVKVPGDRKLLHVIPRTYMVDGQEGVKNPVGMHGFRLDVETHIITAAVTSIQNLAKCIRGVGIEIDDLVLEPLASAEAVLSDEEKQTGVILADIGGGTTDIAVFKDNTIYHTSVLPVAGHLITRDISVGMGLSFDLAEEMKRKYGNVMPVQEENADQDQTLTQDGHSVSYRDLSEIIRIRVDELIRLIVLELPHTDYAKIVPSGIVLTGGSANLPGIAELGMEVTHLPVRVGAPVNLYGVSDTLRDPAYATGVGLLMWKMRNEDTNDIKAKQPESGLHRLVSGIFRLFK